MSRVHVDDESFDTAALPLLGHGGEADVFDLGDRALKLYKAPRHPDVAGDPAREAAAAARLADAEARLGGFPRGLSDRVIAPVALARGGRARRAPVIGYAMRKVAGRPLYELCEPRVRRGGAIDLIALVAALRDLHATVDALHAADVIIGDFNDGNVLIDAHRAALIDADSFAYGRWPCPMFTERFVDPRLCDRTASAPLLVRAHDRDSDWFAFAVMLFRTLVWVGPFGGVHQPADPSRRVAPAARPLRGPTVFDPAVIHPRSAAPLAALSDELASHFESVFARGVRGRFPPALLDRLRLTRCSSCGIDHARTACPGCKVQIAAPMITGSLVARAIEPGRFTPPTIAIGGDPTATVWLAGGTLWRRGSFGPEAIGRVVAGATRAWLGASMGAGMWRAGGYAIAFTFDPAARAPILDDRARLPAIRGRVIADGCAIGDDRAWLWWREADAGRERVRIAVVGAGRVLATADHASDDPSHDWIAGLAGACAAGPRLLVPTDGGVVRVAITGGDLAIDARFPDTAAVVAAADDLAVLPDGLAVRKAGSPARTFVLNRS